MKIRSDRDGETQTGLNVHAGTEVTYLGHLPGGMIRVMIDNKKEVMHPGCFAELRRSLQKSSKVD